MMSDFASMDWDLQAVIRGWSNGGGDATAAATTATTNMMMMNNHEGNYDLTNDFDPSFDEQDRDLLFNTFPEIFESSTANYYDELEGMYKPFYQQTATSQFPESSQSQLLHQPSAVLVKQEETGCGYNSNHQQNGSSPIVSAMTSSSTAAQVAKYKRSRKNQQKRVVQQARAEGLSSSDMWAWRKYGQKPIKGSPYPRSYYRCSSSKGCPARKQVEQSCSDPGMYIITYTAEHNHSHPTRRNSLSGVARTKFSAPPKDSDATRDHLAVKDETFAPISENIVKTEDEEENCDEIFEFMPYIAFTDELFPSLDDLHECIMDY